LQLTVKCIFGPAFLELSVNDLVTALAHLLSRRQLTAEDLAAIIEKTTPTVKREPKNPLQGGLKQFWNNLTK
jgi:predicted transcriptional regulator